MRTLRVLPVLLALGFSSSTFAWTLPETLTQGFTEADVEYACSFAPSQSAIVNRISALASGSALAAEVILLTNQLKYVAHSSGHLIMTSNGKYLANTIGTTTARSASQMIVPVALVITGTAVAVELACVRTNHPELLAKLKENSSEYVSNANALLENASVRAKEVSSPKLDSLKETFKKYKTITEDKLYELMGETWYQRAVRKTKDAFKRD